MRLFHKRSIVCRQAVELMTDYLEGALGARNRRSLEAHLADCPHCSEYLEQMRASIDLLGRIEPEALSPQAADDLNLVYQQWLLENQERS